MKKDFKRPEKLRGEEFYMLPYTLAIRSLSHLDHVSVLVHTITFNVKSTYPMICLLVSLPNALFNENP